MDKKIVIWILMLLAHASASAQDSPLVGRWRVDFAKTAESLGNSDKAKGFLASSQGLLIEMDCLRDGTMIFTKTFGDESETIRGKYQVKKQDPEFVVIELVYPLKGIRFEQIYQFPQDFVNQEVLMKGTFREHYSESDSFGLGQGDYVIEVFYENLSAEKKTEIKKQAPGAETPVVVSGVLGRSSIEDDEVYYIEAAAVAWKKDAMAKEAIRVKLNGPDGCEMPFPGLGMSLIWRRDQ